MKKVVGTTIALATVAAVTRAKVKKDSFLKIDPSSCTKRLTNNNPLQNQVDVLQEIIRHQSEQLRMEIKRKSN